MINIVKGNLLFADESVLVHQVNVHGIMGAGVALQIKNQFPVVYEIYKQHCEQNRDNPLRLLGSVMIAEESNKKVANLFCQNVEWSNCMTDYEAMKKCFTTLNTMGLDIAVPYGIGCGIAGGNWDMVYSIIEDACQNIHVTIYQLED